MRIYRKIDNNNIGNDENNIILEFVCKIGLWNATDYFSDFLAHNDEDEEFYDVSEISYSQLVKCLDDLKTSIRFSRNASWLREAKRCYEILNEELENRNGGYYIIYLY